MKILDRYVVKSYLFAYVVVFVSLVMMVMLFDFLLSIDEFFKDFGKPGGPQGVGEVLAWIGSYYAIHSSHYFAVLSGFIAVISAGFVLARMSYSNELTAVLASGVSLQRVLLPLAVCAFVLNVLLVADQEYIMPALREKLILERDDMYARRSFEVLAFRDDRNSLICASDFRPENGEMKGVLIIERTAPATAEDIRAGKKRTAAAVAMIRAESAIWTPDPGSDEGKWVFVNARRLKRETLAALAVDQAFFDAADDALAAAGDPVAEYRSNMNPVRLRQHRYAKFLDFLSYAELVELSEQPQISNSMRAELQVLRHLRITQPLVNMLLMLSAVPFFLTRERTNLIISSALAILLVGGGMGLTFLAAQWAFEQSDPVWYLAGAWVPVAVFAPLAVLSVEGIKT